MNDIILLIIEIII